MSDTEDYSSEDEPHDEQQYNPTGSQILLSSLFQKILDQQEGVLLTNFSILMEADDILLDLETKNDLMQEQFQTLVSNLTTEFHQIFAERNSVEADEFNKCPICFGDETPYIRLNCSCQLMLHRECYIEYLNQNRQLKCPICQQTIFTNYLE